MDAQTTETMTGFTKTTPLTELSSPPKPSLAFRVGVVGHRPNRLHDANLPRLEQVIREILQAVQEEVRSFAGEQAVLFSHLPPVLRAISPLAEGTDRLFAEQALDLGWELCCVMPFHQEEFEKDFQPGTALETDSLDRFRCLLQRAANANRLTSFQLDGNRANAGAAYGLGGRVVLNQSDLLVVVWDGVRQGKRGGTEETLDEARRHGVPVIWVDAQAPHAWQRIDSSLPLSAGSGDRAIPDGSGTPDTIRQVVRGLLAVPEPPPSQTQKEPTEAQAETTRQGLERFYAEKKPKRSWAVLWKAFRDSVADSSFPKVRVAIPPFEQAVISEWPMSQTTPVEAMVNRLRPFYAWPDKLSVLCSDRYRSAYILVFLLAATTVALALAPIGLEMSSVSNCEQTSTLLELAAIMVILLVVLLGRAKKWHERWIDYRLAAELLRHLRVVIPIGGERPFPQVPAHHAFYGHPSATWMDWYVRAVTRQIGLPNARLDRDYLKAILSHLKGLLAGQLEFHQTNARRSRTIERRMHTGIVGLLALTLVACLLHLLHLFLPGNVLTFFCGFFPALGAALAGINNQGEFRRVAKRSEAMEDQLKTLQDRVTKLLNRAETVPTGTLTSEVGALASDSARLLVNEVLDWRVVFLDRPLEVGP